MSAPLDILLTIWQRMDAMKEAGIEEVKVDLIMAIIVIGLNLDQVEEKE